MALRQLSDGQGILWGGARQERARRRPGGRRENPETALLRSIKRWADLHPALLALRRTHCGRSFRLGRVLDHGIAGWPDLTGGTHFGAPLVVETKTETGVESDLQTAVLERLRAWGWIVLVPRSFGDFLAQLAAEFARRGYPITT